MIATDDTFTVGEALPQLADVSAHDGMHVTVTWTAGSRADRVETIDLAPAVLRYKIYAPLRSDPDLFKTVHVTDDGFAIAWGQDDRIDMASTLIEDLAEQTMTPADFAAFVKRHGYTYDSVAAELGISRRQAAYYQSAKAVPRSIALACAYLDHAAQEGNSSGGTHPDDAFAAGGRVIVQTKSAKTAAVDSFGYRKR